MYNDIEVFAEEIMDQKYQSVTPKEVVDTLDHLSQTEKKQLETVLNKYTRVFDGRLGRYPTAKISIELKPGSRPIWQKPYPVPFQKKTTFE